MNNEPFTSRRGKRRRRRKPDQQQLQNRQAQQQLPSDPAIVQAAPLNRDPAVLRRGRPVPNSNQPRVMQDPNHFQNLLNAGGIYVQAPPKRNANSRRANRSNRDWSSNVANEPKAEAKSADFTRAEKKDPHRSRRKAKRENNTRRMTDYNKEGRKRRNKHEKKKKFQDHMDLDAAKEGIANGTLFEGILRVNPKNARHAYVSCTGVKQDVFINDWRDRNRASHGDRVVLRLMPVEEWRTIVNSDTLELENAVEIIKKKDSDDESEQDIGSQQGSDAEHHSEEEVLAASAGKEWIGVDESEKKAIIAAIFSVKPWGYGDAVKFEDCIGRLQNHLKNGPIKSYIHTLALTRHNLTKFLTNDHCDLVIITYPFSRNSQFQLEEENTNGLDAFRQILEKSPRLPSILISDCPQTQQVEQIATIVGIPYIVTIMPSAHNSNHDAQTFLELFLPLLLTRQRTVQKAFQQAWRSTKCDGIQLKENDKKGSGAIFRNHPEGLSIEIADTREVDVGLLPTKIDSRQWGRDDDISNILEKLRLTSRRMIFVHSIVSGMGLHSVMLVAAREAARLNRFPRGIYVFKNETLSFEIVEKVVQEQFTFPDMTDPIANSVLLLFPMAKQVSDEFISQFEKLMKENTHIWSLIGVRGRSRSELEKNETFDHSLFDHHELAPLDPGFAGIILWEQVNMTKSFRGSKAGDSDLTEWRESPLWKIVPTLPDIIVECAKLMQNMGMSHAEMAKLLTLHEHSTSEWNTLLDPPSTRVAELSQAVVDFLKSEYNVSIDMNAVREWVGRLDEKLQQTFYQRKDWKALSTSFLTDSIRHMYSELSPTQIANVIEFRALCNRLRKNLPEPRYTAGSGRDPIPAPQMNESLLQTSLDLSSEDKLPLESKSKSKGSNQVQHVNRRYYDDDRGVHLEMPDLAVDGYRLAYLNPDELRLSGPLVQMSTPSFRAVPSPKNTLRDTLLEIESRSSGTTYQPHDLLLLRREYEEMPNCQFPPIIVRKEQDDQWFGRIWDRMQDNSKVRFEFETLNKQASRFLDGEPIFSFKDEVRGKRKQFVCSITVSCEGTSITKQATTKSNTRQKAINNAMIKMNAFFTKLLANKTTTSEPEIEVEPEVANNHPKSHPELQPVGKVAAILEHSPHDVHIGYIKPFRKNNKVEEGDRWVRFVPLDSRVSKAFFPRKDCFKEFLEKPGANHRNRYLRVKYLPWEVTQQLPGCELVEEVGLAGDLEVETEAILSMSKIRQRGDFPEAVVEYVNKRWGDFKITEDMIKGRKDCRKLRIFSIDPPTARDLDDALSLEPLPNGNFRIGVHIADVSHFVEEGDPIDVEARKRCTSVYLVQKVIPMLPRLLCENLCSINPDVERLAFSTFFEMTKDGILVEDQNVWYGKTVIKSCAKLDYGVALGAIRGTVNSVDDIDASHYCISEGVDFNDIISDIRKFWMIAEARRKWRFDTGSLTLDKVKMTFRLSQEWAPVKWLPYKCAESNWLIEEYMLLANMVVAKQLLDKLPELAFIRRHPPPNIRTARRMIAICKARNIHLDFSSAGSLQNCLDTLAPKMRRLVEQLLTKPMNSAEYLCAGLCDEPSEWRHFALNFEHYTHFTSPIRRYADLMVHRQLSHTLPSETFNFMEDQNTVRKIADACNEMKMNSKKAQDRSSLLFLCLFIDKHPITATATIVDIGNKSFTICIDSMGIDNRVSCSSIPKCKQCGIVGKMPDAKLKIVWNCGTEEEFGIFDDFQVQLTANKKSTPMTLLTLPVSPETRSAAVRQESFAETRTGYEKIIEKDPNDAATLLNYAILLSNNFEEHAEARKRMEQALKITPEDEVLHKHYATLLKKHFDNEELEILATKHENNPTLKQIYVSAFELRLDSASPEFEPISSLSPPDSPQSLKGVTPEDVATSCTVYDFD